MLFGIAAKPLAVEGAFFCFFVAIITDGALLHAVCLRPPSAARRGAGENPSTNATSIAASTDTRATCAAVGRGGRHCEREPPARSALWAPP